MAAPAGRAPTGSHRPRRRLGWPVADRRRWLRLARSHLAVAQPADTQQAARRCRAAKAWLYRRDGYEPVAQRLRSVGGSGAARRRIYAVDASYHRVLIWRSLPTQNNQLADVVLGQPDLDSAAPNRGGAVGPATLLGPRGIFVDDGHIYVVDSGNHRILVWNTNEPNSGQPADAVIGQPSFSDSQGCVSGRLCSPQGFAALGNRIYIVENQNSRILSFGSRLPAAGELPDRVCSQPDLTTTTPNLGRLAIDRLYTPQGIVATDRGLYISDTGNGRVIVLPPNAP